MKNLLGTNLGHAALLTMCKILNDELMYNDEALLRGAVFHINMGLWGSAVPKLRCSPSTVLMSFLHVSVGTVSCVKWMGIEMFGLLFQALGSKRIIVTYEVILSIQRLIKMNGNKLSEPSWDVICDILLAISENILFYGKFVLAIGSPCNVLTLSHRAIQLPTQRSHRPNVIPRNDQHHRNIATEERNCRQSGSHLQTNRIGVRRQTGSIVHASDQLRIVEN